MSQGGVMVSVLYYGLSGPGLSPGRDTYMVINQVRGQDGWILAKLFFAYSWTETELRSIHSQKKERDRCRPTLAEQAWSIKDLLYGFQGNVSRRTR